MNKHILMIVTSHNHLPNGKPTGMWFEEFAIPYQIFRAQGYRVTVASPTGGSAPIDPGSLPADGEPADLLGVVAHTRPLAEIRVEDHDALFLPGGHGTMFDLPSPAVGALVGRFADQGKAVAAVCHGPAGLVAARRADGRPVVAGHQLTAFTNAEEAAVHLTEVMPFLLETRLRELGAAFIDAPLWSDHVVVDRLLITGQNPQSSASAAQALVEVLRTTVVPG
jgi:putative intracellular protease/amidase